MPEWAQRFVFVIKAASEGLSARIISVTDWIGIQLHVSSSWASRAGFLVLFGVGMGFVQVDEYALALASWIVAAVVLFSKAIHWPGLPQRQILSRTIRVCYVMAAVLIIPVFVVWTQEKRGDKPWTVFHLPQISNSQKSGHDVAKKSTTPSTPPVSQSRLETSADKSAVSTRTPGVKADLNCIVTATVTSRITSRLNGFGEIPAVGVNASTSFQFQELFYDWSIALSSNSKSIQGDITVRDSHALNDKIRIIPEDAGSYDGQIISHWTSGFEEPRTPDYYTKVIHIRDISTATGINISLRRAFTLVRGNNSWSQTEFMGRSITGKFANCGFVSNGYDETTHSALLVRQFITLATWKYAGPDNPSPQVIMNPDQPLPPLATNQTRVTVEAHCSNDDCTTLQMERMEAIRGR